MNQQPITEFVFKGITFLVKRIGDRCVYRDKNHLGGAWSDASRSITNMSLDLTFRRLLTKARADLQNN